MNRETDTVFLQTLGKFVSAQVQLATMPLLQKIESLEKVLHARQVESENASKEFDGAIEGFAAEIARLEKQFDENNLKPSEVAAIAEGICDIRIDAMQKPENGKDGADGKDAVLDYDMIGDVIALGIETEIKKFSVVDGKDGVDGKNGVDGKDGKDGTSVNFEEVLKFIQTEIDAQIKELPIPKDGKDGVDGTSGKDADMESLFAYIENYMKAIPLPQNGKDGKDGLNGTNGKDGPAGRDGADVVACIRDSDRHLILTLSNGMTKDIGTFDGRDGKDGAPGLNGNDGKDGKDGRDGFGFDDMTMEDIDGKKYLTFHREGDDRTKRFHIPIFVYRGVWREGKYDQSDCVTLGGSLFIAHKETTTKPETTGTDWQLAVKRGDIGKRGDKGEPGENGKHGRDGRDLTQMGPDGSKWR